MPPKKIFKVDTSQKNVLFYLESLTSDKDSTDANHLVMFEMSTTMHLLENQVQI